jgi:hypothetical protein
MSFPRGRLILSLSLALSFAQAAQADQFFPGVMPGFPGVMPFPTYPGITGVPGVMPAYPGIMPAFPPGYPVVPTPAPKPTTSLVRAFTSSSDSLLVAAWTPDNKIIQLWSIVSGKEIDQLKGHDEGVSMAFAPDGKMLASADRTTLRFWDLATRQERLRRIDLKGFPKQKSLAWSPDGKVIAVSCTGQPQSLTLWEPATGDKLRQFRGHNGNISALVFAPDAKLLATGGEDGTVRLWDLATGKDRVLAERLRKITALAFAGNGGTLAAADENRVLHFWDLSTGKEVRRVERSPYEGRIEAIAFSPDGKTLATSGLVPIGWGQPGFGNLGHGGYGQFGVQGVGHFGNLGGQFGLSGGPGRAYAPTPPPQQVVLWEVATGKERGSLPNGGKSVAFGANGKSLILGIKDNKVLVEKLAGVKFALCTKTLTQPNDPDSMWIDLIGADTGRAYRAIWALAAMPDRAVPLLRERVRPAAPPLDPRLIDRWIADLESDRFDSRQRATLELEKAGRQAEKALVAALKNKPSLEMSRRVERLLARLQEKGLAPEPVRVARAIEALEQMEAPEARPLLEMLAKGLPGATVTEEAEAALTRLAKAAP